MTAATVADPLVGAQPFRSRSHPVESRCAGSALTKDQRCESDSPSGGVYAGPQRKDKDFILEAPPELPRTIEVSAVRKALPWVFGVVIVGMVVMMFVTGFRQMNPMYLFFMAMMAIALFSVDAGPGRQLGDVHAGGQFRTRRVSSLPVWQDRGDPRRRDRPEGQRAVVTPRS